ncbi:hypothetical protein OGZ01_06610 [Vibrio harveyi]|nr:hypothetical protein [Vibrio harveyi]
MFEYTLYEDLASEVDIPKAGITSCPVYKSERLRGVIFGFAEGEEMSEHTAAVPAIAQNTRRRMYVHVRRRGEGTKSWRLVANGRAFASQHYRENAIEADAVPVARA